MPPTGTDPRPADPSRSRFGAARHATLGLLRRTPPLAFAMGVLSVGLVTASAVLVKGLRRAADSITVTGASTERIRSDHAEWTVEVASTGPTQPESWRGLQPALDRTEAFLRAQGIGSGELERGSVRSEKEDVRDPRTGELRSTTWTARQELRIGSGDVARIQTISGRIGELIGQGVPLTISQPAYTFSGLAAKRVDMLAKATRDARQRAQAIAREAGSHVGPITSADTGTFQITAPNSTEASNAGSYDTRTIEKDITAVMAVTFRVR